MLPLVGVESFGAPYLAFVFLVQQHYSIDLMVVFLFWLSDLVSVLVVAGLAHGEGLRGSEGRGIRGSLHSDQLLQGAKGGLHLTTLSPPLLLSYKY